MTFSTIIVVLIIGIAMLLLGMITKTNWLKLLSFIPLVISLWQLVRLYLMGMT